MIGAIRSHKQASGSALAMLKLTHDQPLSCPRFTVPATVPMLSVSVRPVRHSYTTGASRSPTSGVEPGSATSRSETLRIEPHGDIRGRSGAKQAAQIPLGNRPNQWVLHRAGAA
jgi:hypothetical protein